MEISDKLSFNEIDVLFNKLTLEERTKMAGDTQLFMQHLSGKTANEIMGFIIRNNNLPLIDKKQLLVSILESASYNSLDNAELIYVIYQAFKKYTHVMYNIPRMSQILENCPNFKRAYSRQCLYEFRDLENQFLDIYPEDIKLFSCDGFWVASFLEHYEDTEKLQQVDFPSDVLENMLDGLMICENRNLTAFSILTLDEKTLKRLCPYMRFKSLISNAYRFIRDYLNCKDNDDVDIRHYTYCLSDEHSELSRSEIIKHMGKVERLFKYSKLVG